MQKPIETFSTKRYDPNTGLNYYGYRFYSPSIGRWINRDPKKEAGGINLYAFVLNNPVNWIDPLGLDSHSSKNPDPYEQCRYECQKAYNEYVDYWWDLYELGLKSCAPVRDFDFCKAEVGREFGERVDIAKEKFDKCIKTKCDPMKKKCP